MSIQVTLLTFNKRENSTKKPTTADLAGGAALDCLLIDETSLMNPTFKFNVNGNPVGYNYCYVPSFERYFFINDWSSSQGFWYASCTCDVLASWKTEIGAGSHYILRSASAYDEYISDMAYATKVKETGVRVVGKVGVTNNDDAFSWSQMGHSYVLGIVGYAPSSSSDQTGSVTYYQMNDTELYAFCTFLMNNLTTWSNINTSEYSMGVQAALLNPQQYIASAMVIPVPVPSTLGVQDIRFGYYNYHIGGNLHIISNSTNPVHQTAMHFNIPKHPQAATRGKFLNCAPYTSYVLHLGPFGDIPLDPADLVDEEIVDAMIEIDMMKGMGSLKVISSPTSWSNVLYSGTCQIGADINITQVLRDLTAQQQNAATGLFSIYGSAVHTDLFGGLSSIANMVCTGDKLKYPMVSGGSSAGSFMSFHTEKNCYLQGKFFEMVDENITEIGRPLMQTKTINTLSGYIACLNADCIIPGTHDEAEKINGYLNNGFFWE